MYMHARGAKDYHAGIVDRIDAQRLIAKIVIKAKPATGPKPADEPVPNK